MRLVRRLAFKDQITLKCIESLENQTWDLLDLMMMMMMMSVFLVYIYITIELVIAGFLNHQEYFVRYLR